MTSQDELSLRRRVAEEAARAAGAVQLRFYGQALERDVHHGNRADYTTVADLEAQEAVKQTIARHFPGETIVGEEDIELRTRIGDLLLAAAGSRTRSTAHRSSLTPAPASPVSLVTSARASRSWAPSIFRRCRRCSAPPPASAPR